MEKNKKLGKNKQFREEIQQKETNQQIGKKFKDREKSNAIEIKTVKVFGKNFFSQIFILKI